MCLLVAVVLSLFGGRMTTPTFVLLIVGLLGGVILPQVVEQSDQASVRTWRTRAARRRGPVQNDDGLHGSTQHQVLNNDLASRDFPEVI